MNDRQLNDSPRTYLTILLPVATRGASTKWHSYKDRLTRGAFKSREQLDAWVAANIPGCPFEVLTCGTRLLDLTSTKDKWSEGHVVVHLPYSIMHLWQSVAADCDPEDFQFLARARMTDAGVPRAEAMEVIEWWEGTC